MRVLIVDNDSEMLEATARALRDGFSIDVVTGKADALDLLRQNDFHVVVACERLNDGSGLDLLSQTAKRWPETIRLFAATSDRLSLLRGRLGPFKLFQTLDYPINPGQLGSVLMLAQAAQAADVDTTTIQHIVMGEAGSSEVDAPAQTVAAMPVRSLAGGRASPRPLPFSVPTVNPPPPDVPAARRKPLTRESLSNTRHTTAPAPSRPAASHPTAAGFAPPASATQRSRILERTERTPLTQPRDAVTGEVPALSLTATNLRPMPEGISAYRPQLMIGGAAVVVLLALGVGIYLSSGDSDSTDSATPAAAATTPAVEGPTSAADRIIGEIETALTQDQTRRAKAALGRLRRQFPDHPRLAFFEAIVSRRDELERASARRAGETVRAEAPAAPALAQAGDVAQTTPAPPPAEDSAGSAEAPSPAPLTSGEPQPSQPAESPPQASPSSFAGRTLETTDATGTSPAPAAPPAPVSAEPAPARRGSTDPESMPPVVREAKLVRSSPPEYPADAARAGKQGSVDIAFVVTPAGRIAEPVVVTSTDRMFERSALAAVRRWRYDPRMEDGKPVEWRTTVRIEFKLSEKD